MTAVPAATAAARGSAPTPAPALATSPLAAGALSRTRSLVEPGIERALALLCPSLQAPVRYHLSGGGKFLRSALVLLSASAVGGEESAAVAGAVAVELVHNFSLLHDDIIDGDRERRHLPTVWARFGVGPAIIAGDALATLAVQVLLETPTGERALAARRLVEATQAMIAGQTEDMAFESRPSVSVDECLQMAAGKTGALLSCATSIGAMLGGAAEPAVDALGDFGLHLGMAFQAVDDVLGIWGEPARTGKPVGSDLLQHKKSLPVSIALARRTGGSDMLSALLERELNPDEIARATRLIEELGARDESLAIARDELDAAMASLDRVPLADAPRAELAAIAEYVTARDR